MGGATWDFGISHNYVTSRPVPFRPLWIPLSGVKEFSFEKSIEANVYIKDHTD